MINKISIKNLPVNTEFTLNPRKNNISIGIDSKLKILKITSKLTPKKIQTRFSWLKESEPKSHYSQVLKIFKKIIKKDIEVIGLTYRDKEFISLLRKISKSKINCLDRKFYKISDKNIGLSRVQEKISKKKYLSSVLKNKKSKKIILMNHSLHHFMNLNKFLSNLHNFMSQDDIVYIEVPDCEKYFKGFDYTHIFEEHHNYFTEKSLSNLLESFGYKILKFYRHKNKFEDSLNFWIKKINKTNKNRYKTDVEKKYILNYDFSKKKIKDFFTRNKSKKIAIFGAGHHVTSFVNIFDLQKVNFKIYDDNILKKGKYLPGTNFIINQTSSMNKIDILLVGVSPDKEDKIIKKFKHKNIIMRSINPLSKNYFL